MLDFEQAFHTSLRSVFPQVALYGCKFHIQQAISRWLKSHAYSSEEKSFLLNDLSKIIDSEEESALEGKLFIFFI